MHWIKWPSPLGSECSSL